jgi:hypothetical protein
VRFDFAQREDLIRNKDLLGSVFRERHMAGHCLISYSNRDAEDFGPQLSLELEGGHPYFERWYDKEDIPAGQKWDNAMYKANWDCKCFLFVVNS